MFIALARFPDVPADREADFQDWFAWSNRQLADVDGLLGRRLLRTADGHYSALVEHESAATFAAMHAAPMVAQIHARLHQIIPEPPRATQFEVVSELTTGRDNGAEHHCGNHSSEARDALAPGHACCHAD